MHRSTFSLLNFIFVALLSAWTAFCDGDDVDLSQVSIYLCDSPAFTYMPSTTADSPDDCKHGCEGAWFLKPYPGPHYDAAAIFPQVRTTSGLAKPLPSVKFKFTGSVGVSLFAVMDWEVSNSTVTLMINDKGYPLKHSGGPLYEAGSLDRNLTYEVVFTYGDFNVGEMSLMGVIIEKDGRALSAAGNEIPPSVLPGASTGESQGGGKPSSGAQTQSSTPGSKGTSVEFPASTTSPAASSSSTSGDGPSPSTTSQSVFPVTYTSISKVNDNLELLRDSAYALAVGDFWPGSAVITLLAAVLPFA
ncbi:hypothetical protein EXIGLDRAFT_776149 [Exidia glandulosa HHB12029]|uniref:Concanavalin A-like lectin/glucanase n=1 Tax=Exidia glandulosa HHB12029 TaxID=1314781 RepID=A0A165ZQ45_EXIGL|nr:hypothetical protein EXIGLDRAFT_776149 [Exidia glandulosa HHB12029]